MKPISRKVPAGRVEMFDLKAYMKEALFPELINASLHYRDTRKYRKNNAERARRAYEAKKASSK